MIDTCSRLSAEEEADVDQRRDHFLQSVVSRRLFKELS